MADFLKTYQLVLMPNEGGYANVANDAGGETYAGISRNYHPKWAGWPIIDSKKINFKNGLIPRNSKFHDSALETLIQDFYKKEFWDKIFGDQITDQQVADIMMDSYINQTGGFPFMVSNALYTSGKTNYPFYSTPTTKAPAFAHNALIDTNSVAPKIFFTNFLSEREKYYRYRATKPNQESNLPGWLKRLEKFTYTGIEKVVDTLKDNPIKSSLGGFFLLGGLALLWWANSRNKD